MASFTPERWRPAVVAPRAPELPPPGRFPLFASVAPVLGSIVLWLVTRSAFALAFAALGPLVAVATGLDARLQRRRTRRREAARFEREAGATAVAIADAHDRERGALDARWPAASELLGRLQHTPERWRGNLAGELLVRVGTGERRSDLDYTEGTASARPDADGSLGRQLDELRARAAVLTGAPVLFDAREGIGLCGPGAFVLPAARALVLQLAIALSPASHVVSGPVGDAAWDWLDGLPHRRVPPQHERAIVFSLAEESSAGAGALGARPGCALIAIATTATALPRGGEVIVGLEGDGVARVLRDARRASASSSAGPDVAGLHLEYLTEEEAIRAASALTECAQVEGVGPAGSLLPELVLLGEQLSNAGPGEPGLRCVFGVGEQGPLAIDLVRDGPHAIVGGTTGSGKSELLLSWVLALAHERSPADLTLLFVDFKGGASFDPLRSLPHCVGVITDLDAGESLRALSSLGAELRYRERELARHGLRSIEDAADALPFPRLVVVVDEYAALLETHVALHAVFMDIAARGRSLGLHLVLCTQRPAGVMREGILANCGLRVSLRVNNAADSKVVIGTDEAAALPATPLGRALVSAAGAAPRVLQVARSSEDDVRVVAERWAGSPPPRKPWCAPLPARIPLSRVTPGEPDDTVPIAIVDRPDLQRQDIARYDPRVHGSMLVVGGTRSGKSDLLDTLCTAPSRLRRKRVASGLPAVWDALTDAVASGQTGRNAELLLIDDLDALVASCSDDYQTALLDLLARVLRDGPALGVRLVITVQRLPGQLQTVAALCGSRLLLGMPNRQEHALAGGDSTDYQAALTPGAGHWQGHRIQLLHVDERPVREPGAASDPVNAVEVNVASGSPLAIVSTRPHVLAEELAVRAPGRRIILLATEQPGSPEVQSAISGGGGIPIGDPDSWQSHWSAFMAFRGRADLLFDGCALVDLRTLARVRELPPPFASGERPLWVLGSDGCLARARLGPGPA